MLHRIVLVLACVALAGADKGSCAASTEASQSASDALHQLHRTNKLSDEEFRAQLEALTPPRQWSLAEVQAHDKLHNRDAYRTWPDEKHDPQALLKDLVIFLHVLSRCMLFLGALTCALCFLIIVVVALLDNQPVNEIRSVSSLVWDLNSPQGKMFKGFVTMGWTLVMLSGFAFFCLPRWAITVDECPIYTVKGVVQTVEWLTHMSPVGAFTAEERQSSWILRPEGVFKICWMLFSPLFIVLVAQVPVTERKKKHPDIGAQFERLDLDGDGKLDEKEFKAAMELIVRATKQQQVEDTSGDKIANTVHTLCAVLSFAVTLLNELYQLIHGEQAIFHQFHDPLTGILLKAQLGRFVCTIIATCCLIGYVVADATDGRFPLGIVGFVCEAMAGLFVCLDFILISYTPPSASLVGTIFGL